MSDTKKCPYCEAEFDKSWKVTNHVRIASGDHGPKHSLPKDYVEEIEDSKPVSENEKKEDFIKQNNENNENNQTIIKKEVIKVELPEKLITKTSECPDCGANKSEWIEINHARENDINVTDEDIEEYDFVCPSPCYELIKVKKE